MLPAATAVAIMRPVLSALAAAHETGGGHKLLGLMNTCLSVESADIRFGDILLGEFLAEAIPDQFRCDSNGDDMPDGWPLQLVADFEPSGFDDDPEGYLDAPIDPVCD